MNPLELMQQHKKQADARAAEREKPRINELFVRKGDEITVRILTDTIKMDHFLYVNQNWDDRNKRYLPTRFFASAEDAQNCLDERTDLKKYPNGRSHYAPYNWYVPVIVTDIAYGPESLAYLKRKDKDVAETKAKLLDGTVRFFRLKGGDIDDLVTKFKYNKATETKWVIEKIQAGDKQKITINAAGQEKMTADQKKAVIPNLRDDVVQYHDKNLDTPDIDAILDNPDVVQDSEDDIEFE